MTSYGTKFLALAAAIAIPALGGCGTDAPTEGGPSFADIAPIVFENCSGCHRPDEAAPFSLLSYEDVRRRARQIQLVTESGYMPPWLPAANTDPHVAAFEGDRSLSDEERALLDAWIEAGMAEGPRDAIPAPPEWPEGWQLGTPDLVLTMPDAFVLPEEGRDIYRNFVIPPDAAQPRGQRHVRAVEWRPDNRQVVHHAVLYIDRTGAVREREAKDPGLGFGGMSAAPAQMPEGQFYGWTPGNVPRPGDERYSWLLDDRTDVILQLHLRPTGAPESVQVSIGLYFADAPPVRHPMSLRLRSRVIDIPPGKKDYVVRDSYVLPKSVSILGLYPHAHYLGKDLRGWASLPDGTERQLFHIPEWDFNWQDDYFYEEPLQLPAGTKLSMRYVYDNSAENALNPHSPPRHVVFGEQSDDEMAELMMLVLPESEDELPILWRDFSWKLLRDSQKYFALLARSQPDNAGWSRQLADLALRAGQGAEAVKHHRRWIELRPRNKTLPYIGLARGMLLADEADQAVATLRAVLERKPNHFEARTLLGRALLDSGELKQARAELETVLASTPSDAQANLALGDVCVRKGLPRAAEKHYRQAMASDPFHVGTINRVASLQTGEAELRLLHTAVRNFRENFLEADHGRQTDEQEALWRLAHALEELGRLDEALRYLSWARGLGTSGELSAEAIAAAQRRVLARLETR